MLLGAKHVLGRVGVELVYLVSVCRMLTIETRRPEVTLSKFLGKCIRPLFLTQGFLPVLTVKRGRIHFELQAVQYKKEALAPGWGRSPGDLTIKAPRDISYASQRAIALIWARLPVSPWLL